MGEAFQGKVLFFIESGGPGGAERVVLSLAEEYQRRNIPVLVATLRRGWFTEQVGFRRLQHTLLPCTGKSFDFGSVKALRDLIRRERISVVHSHLLDSNFYGSLACFLAGIPHVATEHGDVHHTKQKRFAKIKMFLADRLGTRFTSVSAYTATHLRKHGVRKKKITIIGNPIATPRFDFRPERATTRARLGVVEERESHWVWIHVANFRPVKDQSTLLRGFARSVRQSPFKQTLVLVGDGPEKEGLLALSTDLGIQPHVRWVGFSDEVGVHLAAADGFILSSISEALPMSLLEAALYELVIVSTRVGGVPEVIRENETGYLFNTGDPDALADVLQKILSDRASAISCGPKVKQLVLKEFLLERVVEKFLALYV